MIYPDTVYAYEVYIVVFVPQNHFVFQVRDIFHFFQFAQMFGNVSMGV